MEARSQAVAHYEKAMELYEQGRLDEALARLTDAIRLDDALWPAYTNRGYIYFLRGDFREAMRDFNRAIRLNPEEGRALANRGATLVRLQRYEEALADLNKAIGLAPQRAQAYSDRGSAYRKLGREQKAIADFNRAIELDPSFAAPFFNLGGLLAQRGALYEALPYFRRALRLGLSQARGAMRQVRQDMFVAATKDGSLDNTVQALLDSETEREVRELAERYPYVLLPEFVDLLEQSFRNILRRSVYRPYISLLRELAEEDA